MTLIAMTAVTASGVDAPDLTLDEAIAEALAKNPGLRAMSADVEAARGESTSASKWQNPELSIAPGVVRFQSSGDDFNQFHGVFGLTQLFEFPGKRTLRRALADKTVEMRQLALEGFRTQLGVQVRRAFYALLVSQEVLPLREQRVEQTRKFVAVSRHKAENGFASDFEAIRAEADLVSAQSAMHEAQAALSAGRTTLNTLLGRSPDAPVHASGSLQLDAGIPDAGVIAPLVLEKNASLRVQTAAVELSGIKLQSVHRERMPDFAIGPSIEYKPDEQVFDIGLTLPLPLWDRKKGEIATATAEQVKAVAEMESLRNEVLGDVARAYQSVSSARESLALYTPEFLERLSAAREAAARSYTGGQMTMLVYLDAERAYFDAQFDYLATWQRLFDAASELETAAGIPLSQFTPAGNQGEMPR